MVSAVAAALYDKAEGREASQWVWVWEQTWPVRALLGISART
ncbi:hypothetical protein [Streptomyces sp. NBC_00316]|nr:hypothetical protein [Streptomyces sp. NBC_00316]